MRAATGRGEPGFAWRVGATVVVLSLLAVGCGSTGHASSASTRPAPSSQPRHGGGLVVGVAAETSGWGPAYDEWAFEGDVVGSSVLEPLCTQGADNGAKPWLAKSWIANDTFTRWVINLQPDVTFQDGEPFNAAAVVQNLETDVKGPLIGLALGPMFAGEKALSDLQVEVDLTQPWAAFPNSFLQGAIMMAPSMLNAPDHGSSHPIGTGPFTFDGWQPNNYFRATRNPHYWGGLDSHENRRSGTPYLDSIEFKVIPDSTSRLAALESGDINLMFTTDASVANSQSGSFTVIRDWNTENDFILTNTAPKTASGKPNPLANVHARLALAYATNRDAIARIVGKGVQIPTSPWAPTNPWGMPDAQNGYVDYSLAKAKSEVASYERDTHQSSLSFTLSGISGIEQAAVLQVLQAQWKQAGIEVNIASLDQTTYITQAVTGDFQAMFDINYGYPDPDQDYSFWSSTTAKGAGTLSINFSQYASPEIDSDLTTGRQSGYPAIRKNAYEDLTRQLNAAATHIWLFRTPYSIIAQRTVGGLDAPDGPERVSFGNYVPKTWLGEIWVQ